MFGGSYYTCKYCGEEFMADGWPHFGNGWAIGYYVTQYGISMATGAATPDMRIYYMNPNNVHYTSDSILPGYRFYEN